MFDYIQVIVFICAIVVHELTHYFDYRLRGYKANIKLSGTYLGMITQCKSKKLTLREDTLNRLRAIVLGSLVCIFGGTNFTLAIYLICCSIDIGFIFAMSELKGKKYDLDAKSSEVKTFIKGKEVK